jgi:hypothetical protein
LINGAWVDQTSRLLTDTTGCLHPRKAIVADFNGDDVPDVFIACHVRRAAAPEKPDSAAQPTRRNIQKSRAADYRVYARRIRSGFEPPRLCRHSRHRRASGENAVFPNQQRRRHIPSRLHTPALKSGDKQIFTAELIALDNVGKFDVLLGGNDLNSQGNPDPYTCCEFDGTIYKNLGNNTYDDTHKLGILPIARMAASCAFCTREAICTCCHDRYAGADVL